MSVNFELFEVKTVNSDEIIFSAFVRDEKTYRITADLTGRFKKKFLNIMNGLYKHMYVDQNTEESHEYIIDEGDALANLRKYVSDCAEFSHTIVTLSPSNISHQYTLHFYGIDYNMSKGMEPKAAHRAYDFFYELGKISQMRIPANNYLSQKPSEFTTAEAASLKLEMYSSVEMVDFKIVFKQLLEDIKNGALSSEAVLADRYKMYKRLLSHFKELVKFTNLDLLSITIDGEETKLTNFNAISELGTNIYGATISGQMVIQSVHDYYRNEVLDGLVVDTLSFSQITTWKYPKNNTLSKFLHNAKGEQVLLIGNTTGENLRSLVSIEFLNDSFTLSDEDEQHLKDDGFAVIGKKILL